MVPFPVYPIDAFTGDDGEVYIYGATSFVTHAKEAAYLINIHDYEPPRANNGGLRHENHAISAIRRRDKLYVFDPWGQDRKQVSQVVGRILKRYMPGVTTLSYYNGPNLQMSNTHGACVGLSANLIIWYGQGMSLNNKTVQNTIGPRVANIGRNITRFEKPGPLSVVKRSV